MHEVSLGITLRDYLTGEQIDQTTYEDLRQALARMLVKEFGYPAEYLKPRVKVRYLPAPPAEAINTNNAGDNLPTTQASQDKETYCRTIDIVVYNEANQPVMLVLFCPGQVNTYRRETIAAARLISNGPAPLAVITDTRQALLVATASDTVLGEGIHAIPHYDTVKEIAAAHPTKPLSEDGKEKERKILHTYSGFIKTCCDESMCML